MDTAEKINQGLLDGQKIRGKDNVELLLKHERGEFYRNVPFERGLFQQCIPNPAAIDEGQYITVQIVN